MNLSVLKDRIHVIAIKETVDLVPFAEVLYGCDAPWWRFRKGVPSFKGLKICQDQHACNEFGLTKLDVVGRDEIFLSRPGHVGSGGNSGFQAYNLALQFGCTGILLIGFDMRSQGNQIHYYGHNRWQGSSNPIDSNFVRWQRAFQSTERRVKMLGVDVVNTSKDSALRCFRFSTIEQALAVWGL